MTLDELILQVAEALDRERIPFFLIGGLAVSTWVEPRATKDMDVVLKVRRQDSARLKKALVAAGTRATALEIRILMEKRFVRFRTGGPLLDVRITASRHDARAYERSVAIDYRSRPMKVATAEDLILYKLQAWRPLDQRDVLSLLQISDLDVRYITSWLDKLAHDTGQPIRARWNEIRRDSPYSG